MIDNHLLGPVANILWLGLVLGIVWFCCNQLSRQSPQDVRITFFAFSLSLMISAVILAWAVLQGSLDPKGAYVGEGGKLLGKVIQIALDVEFDVAFPAGTLAIVVGPQLLNYVLSGMFGCAAKPILVGKTFAFAIWSFVKSMAVIAGVLVSIAGFSTWYHWSSLTGLRLFAATNTAVSCLAIALLALTQYRELLGIEQLARRSRILAKIHEKATRRTKERETPIRPVSISMPNFRYAFGNGWLIGQIHVGAAATIQFPTPGTERGEGSRSELVGGEGPFDPEERG